MVKQKIVAGTMGIADGTNKRINPFIGGNGLWKCQGFHFDEQGSLTKWEGMIKGPGIVTNKMTETDASDATIKGLFFILKTDGGGAYFAITKTRIYYIAPTNLWTALTLPETFNSLTYFQYGTVINDILYVGVWDISTPRRVLRVDPSTIPPTVTFLGIASPTGATVDNATAGGSMTVGTYSYKVTFYNSTIGQESNPSPVSGGVTLTAGNQQVSLTSIPVSSDTQVNRRRLYRTTVNGGIWLYLGEITDNTTTTYTDNIPDSSLGIAIEETGNGVPPALHKLADYKGHIFGSTISSSRLWFSGQGKPGSFDSNDFRDLTDSAGAITAIVKFLGQLIIFKSESIWIVTGEDRNTFIVTKQLSGIGTENQHNIIFNPEKNILMFIYQQSIFAYDGTSIVEMSSPIKAMLNSYSSSSLNLYSTGVFYQKKNLCLWFMYTGSVSSILAYDNKLDQWMTRGYASSSAQRGVTNFDYGKIYIGGTDGYVRQLDTGTSDDGTAIVCEAIDRAIPRDLADATQKNFFEVEVFFAPNTGSVVVSYKLNTPSETAGDFTTIGTIDTSAAKGSARLRFNAIGQRIYLRFYESSTTNTVVLRGWHVFYKVLGRES